MHENDTVTASRRRFLERILAAGIVAAAAPSVLLGRVTPSLRMVDGMLAGRYRIDLNDPKFASLVPVGGSMTLERMSGVTFRVIVNHVDETTFIALNATCTHLGCRVAHVQPTSNDLLVCPCHGSRFRTDGSVFNGPAEAPLQRLETFYDGDSIVEVEVVGLIAGVDDEIATGAFARDAVYDPAQSVVSVELVLESGADVRATVFDAAGARIAHVPAAHLDAGEHTVRVAIDAPAAGTYFMKIETDRRSVIARRFVVAR